MRDKALLEMFPDNAFLFAYDQEAFKKYAEDRFKVDKVVLKQKDDPHPCDYTWLVSCIAENEVRDLLTRWNSCRYRTRSQTDHPLTLKKQIMTQIQTAFNSKTKVYVLPQRAEYLHTISDLDPNNKERVAIERDAEWLVKVWDFLMGEYGPAMKRWMSGTGGDLR